MAKPQNTLNPEQKAAVEHLGTPLLVLAGAGSGKTRVITQKIAWLIRKAGFKAYQIAAITFTNKAAREMKERAGSLLKKDEKRGLMVSTFHTLGLTIIRRESKTLGYKQGFSIFDAQDSGKLLKELALKEDMEEYEPARWQISRWKNDFVSPEQALAQAALPDELFAARLYERYQRQLKAYNAVDFDDLIVLPVQLFNEKPEVLQKWQSKLRYLLVDEYQDTNQCQYQLIQQLAGLRGEFTVVGDDDQSIYAWRGARPENIHQLKQDYPMLNVVKLEQNYRSTSRILQSANQLIANNPHLFEKRLWSALDEGEKIQIVPCRNAEHEAERVVNEIMKLQFKENANAGDFAILYRSNHQARVFERQLRERNIPYKLSGGMSFFERAEVKDMIAYLRLLANPNDDAAFLRIINTPKREIGASTLEKLGAYATERQASLFAASNEMGLAQRLSKRAQLNLERFSDWVQELLIATEQMEPHDIAKRILRDTHYNEWLRENSSSRRVSEQRMKNVMDVIEWIQRLYDEGEGKESLAEIVAHMTLMDILERNAEEKQQDAVSLMTLHAAKGLEFPHVFLVGMEEELLPHRNSVEEGNLEEERRLAYVGITRARQRLCISFAKVRSRYGEKMICEPSRFLEELPESHIEWEDRKVVSDEEKREMAQSYLADIKSMLGD